MPRADSPPHIDHFSNKVIRPFLTGSFAHSMLIDITIVEDQQKIFLKELDHFCSGKLHLWGVSDKIRKDYSRLFAEIAVSPELYQKFKVEPTFSLPSFPAPFAAYPSLSPSTKIVKVSFSGLPFQYGRESGGSDELFADMPFNLAPFGEVIDCGFVIGSSGLFGGGGYAVLALSSDSENPNVALTHRLNWSYVPVSYPS
ncbi:uncharacterized protein BX663DRAFT_424437, partial [Cokeromyces recurvatus]|uniref:uncharacterized protein n=1 Tax=Cokeromyces recurvatus TaxID=90255 RepID=UPI0022204135